jgi:ABC-type sugar transport system substrate-binding protein
MILMFVCLALLLVLAPSFASGQKDGAAKSGKVWKVGVSTQAWKYEFIKNLVNALQAADKNIPELELTIIDSEDSVEKQLNDIDSLIAKKVDGIIMDGNSFEGCSPAVVACKKANIPMVQVVTYTQNEDYHTFVGTDVKSSGFMAADAIAKAVGEKGNVFMIEGMMGASGQINRSAGISEGLAKYPGIKLVEKQTGEWSKDKSIALAENWLTKYPKIDGIVAQNDGMALGAMNACIAAGRTSIKLVGIDGDSEALQAVIDGTFSATILDDVWTEARLAVEAMRDILAGKDVPKKIIVDYVPVTTKEKAKEFLSQRGK